MDIGVIGAGNIGATAAGLFARAGHDVVLSNSRGPESLGDVVAALGDAVRAGDVAEAARFGEIVLVAIPLHGYERLPVNELAGKIVIDAMNYYPGRDGQIEALARGELGSSELVARHVEGARVVKAFNTMYFKRLAEEGRPEAGEDERLAMFVAGDDEQAKQVVGELIRAIGFAPVDTGSLRDGGRRQQPGNAIYNEPLTGAEGREMVG